MINRMAVIYVLTFKRGHFLFLDTCQIAVNLHSFRMLGMWSPFRVQSALATLGLAFRGFEYSLTRK
jgi:hypothetical protein